MPIIRGIATDVDTGEAISNARVDIKNDESYRTSTDAEGKFEIEVLAGEYTVDLRSKVYKSVDVGVAVEEGEEAECKLESEKKRGHR